MSKDPTFKVLVPDDARSEEFKEYRKDWDDRIDLVTRDYPVHLDVETVATCDLKCGSNAKNPEGFCQIWTHEHIRKLGFGDRTDRTMPRGMIEPRKFYQVINAASKIGVKSIKLNYRGEPTLHPHIEDFVRYCHLAGFTDIMMNTNGNGGARKDPELFYKLVKAGITSLNFSVDADDEVTYNKQRVGGDWKILLNSVRSAVIARDLGLGHQDLRIRASAVRTKLNRHQIDNGRLQDFWTKNIGVDWVSISECYFPAGTGHEWRAMEWEDVGADEFQCVDPFRRMVVTWDLKNTLPCCQGFTLEIDGGSVYTYADEHALWNAWHSEKFDNLRLAHKYKYWDKDDRFKMCQSCPLTKKPVRIEV